MCPPGTDQTMRSPQCWQLEAPDIQQVHMLGCDTTKYHFPTLVDSLFKETPPFDVFSLLARPVIPKFSPVPGVKNKIGTKSSFDRLSTEMLDMIVEEVEGDKRDLISLALTSTTLWNIIISRTYKSVRLTSAPWANTRILFHGNYSTTLPPVFEAELGPQVFPRRGLWRARRFFWDHHYHEQPVSMPAKIENLRSVMAEYKECSSISSTVWETLNEQLTPTFFPRDRTWLLRNLTKKDYISSDILEQTYSRVPLPQQDEDDKVRTIRMALTFEDILLAKTHWSNIPSSYMQGFGVDEGDWAGDCLDLVTEDMHQLSSEAEVEEWTDVGLVIVKQMKKLRQKIGVGRRSGSGFGKGH